MLGNIKQTSIQSIISGSELRELKHTIAQGQWHPFCSTCQRDETDAGISARTGKVSTVLPATVERIDQSIESFELTDLTINWTNLCNLTCTYCNPETSTAWQQVLKLPITQVRNDQSGLIELARSNRATLRGLTLGGGEPLLQRGLREFLQEIDPEQVSVMITTNLSMDLTRNAIYQLLKQWPQVTWMISFDNARADRFEYVRRGSSWSQFVANIEQLQQDQQRVLAHPAYSVYSALDLEHYYEFCCGHNLPIYWCDLLHPAALDARRLPLEFRQLAHAEIGRILELYAGREDLSLDILARYQQQLAPDWLAQQADRPSQSVQAWHLEQEQLQPWHHTFQDLWPEYQ